MIINSIIRARKRNKVTKRTVYHMIMHGYMDAIQDIDGICSNFGLLEYA